MRTPQRNIFRRVAISLFRALGLLRLWRYANRKKVLILAIHGTCDSGCSSSWRPLRSQLQPAQLDRMLRILSAHYRFVSLDDAVRMIRGEKAIEDNAIAVTFDDGYRNNLKYALPVLAKYGVRPTIFLATGYVDERRPHWFDRLDYALQGVQEPVDIPVAGVSIRVSTEERSLLEDSYSRLRRVAKRAQRDDRETLSELGAIAVGLEERAGHRLQDILEQDDWSSVVTWDEVRSASPAVDFGSHTVDHLRVNRVPPTVAAEQLARSKVRIEEESGMQCRHFAYPDGGFDGSSMELCRKAGYAGAVTMEPGLNSVGDDSMSLKRIPVPLGGTDGEILAEVSGFWHWLRG